LEEAPVGGFLRGAVSSRIGLARLQLDSAGFEEARTLLEAAGLQAAAYGDRERMAEIDALYAHYYLLMGEKETAGVFGAKALDVFERLGMGQERAELRQLLFGVELIY
jgi:hypothetical protein